MPPLQVNFAKPKQISDLLTDYKNTGVDFQNIEYGQKNKIAKKIRTQL